MQKNKNKWKMETLLEKEIVLNVKNVTKVYKTRVAVNNVSFS